MGAHLLSKSSFLKGLQCAKGLYLYKHHYDWADPISDSQQAIFRTGHDVGKLAQSLFPGGVDASLPFGDRAGSDEQVRLTSQLIDSGQKVIYEAAFLFDEVLVIADIMVRRGNKWKLYEVKSSTSVKDVYFPDAAVQYYVISKCGLDVADVSVVYINNKYTRQGELDVSQLFSIQSVRSEVLEMQYAVEEDIKRFKKLLAQKEIPKMDIGPYCNDPYPCSFMGHCWKDVPANSVFDIGGMQAKKKFAMYNEGIVRLEDIPLDYPLNASQYLQVDSYRERSTHIDRKAVREFLDSLSYPLYFLDFETISPAVPLFDNSHPYQQIPFQYSLHYIESPGSETEHYEFLADASGDPRIPFIESLLRDVGKKGDILVYNQAFECTRLKELARDFPEYSKRINNVLSRITDLMVPFKQKHYYTHEMNGSYSIKSVLPALVPEMSYSELEIGEGGTASRAFEGLYFEEDPARVNEVRRQLLEYCGTDTLAMVKIFEVLGTK